VGSFKSLYLQGRKTTSKSRNSSHSSSLAADVANAIYLYLIDYTVVFQSMFWDCATYGTQHSGSCDDIIVIVVTVIQRIAS
jgi:hypothetical protein